MKQRPIPAKCVLHHPQLPKRTQLSTLKKKEQPGYKATNSSLSFLVNLFGVLIQQLKKQKFVLTIKQII